MQKYIIVSDKDEDKCAERVERLLEKGWQLHGGLCVTSVTERDDYLGNILVCVYNQALIKA